MNTKLQYDLHEIGDASKKAIVAIHGWQGGRNSMFPLINSMNINNVGWYLLSSILIANFSTILLYSSQETINFSDILILL